MGAVVGGHRRRNIRRGRKLGLECRADTTLPPPLASVAFVCNVSLCALPINGACSLLMLGLVLGTWGSTLFV